MGTTAAVTVTTTATLVMPANVRRGSFYLLNNGATSMFIGETNSITALTGFPLAAASQVSEDEGNNLWKGDIYAIVAAGTEEARYWERTQSV